MTPTISLQAARRIALGAQGFDRRPRNTTTTVGKYEHVMTRVGLVQLDSVNVCARSHYMPFYARIGAYDQRLLDTWLNSSTRHFEYWAHEACVMPVEQYPLWRWRMRQWQPWKVARKAMDEHPRLVESVLQQVHDRGPLTVRELDAPKARTRSWWGNSPGKLVLETLFGEGKLTALRDEKFARRYDLPTRAIPGAIIQDERYDKHLAHQELLLRATRHSGIGTAKDLADYYRLDLSTAKPLLAELALSGQIEEVHVAGWKGPVYRDPQARTPRAIRGATLLSPFDPLVWYRERAHRLFNFHYRIEIYTPHAKRKYGYYVLPFLLDGEFAARVDLKADRKLRVLHVPSAFIEAGQDKTRVARELAAELERFANWLGLSNVTLGKRGSLMSELRRQRG